MTTQIQSISNKHRLMMEALVFDGLTPREACAKYDMTDSRFSIIRKSPLWILEERELRAQFRLERKKEIESMVPAALKTLRTNLTAAPPATQVTAAKAILDRGGMPANIIISEDEGVADSDALYDTLKSIRDEKQQVLADLGVSSVDELIEGECTHVEEEGALGTNG